MRSLKPFVLIVVLAVAAVGQAKPPKGISVTYDKFNDRTKVETTIGQGWDGPTLSYEFPGEKLKAPVEMFQFAYFHTCETRYCFHDDDEIIFLIDGERLRKEKPIFPGAVGNDMIVFEMSRVELEKIADAKQVEFKVANITDSIRPKYLPKIRALLDYAMTKP